MERSTLLCLPPELLVHIQTFLDHPFDILSLRQTCKHLAVITYDTGLWLRAFLFVSARHNGFMPAYDLANMTQRALEQATLTPYRFGRVLMNGDRIPFSQERIIYPVSAYRDDGTSTWPLLDGGRGAQMTTPSFRVVYLISGGRFLLTLETDQDENIYLRLRDLGQAPLSEFNPLPIASLQCRGPGEVVGLHRTVDFTGLRIFHENLAKDPVAHEICVYEIYPLSPVPSFDLVATLTRSRTRDAFLGPTSGCCTNNIVAFLEKGTLFIWDYVEDTMAAFSVNIYYDHISISGDTVILYSESGFTAVKVSNLVPTAYVLNVPDHKRPPLHSSSFTWHVPRPSPPILGNFHMTPPSYWSPSGPRPMHIVLSTRNESQYFLHHFELEKMMTDRVASSTASATADPLLKATFLGTTPSGSPYQGVAAFSHSGRFCGDLFAQFWFFGRAALMVTVSDCSQSLNKDRGGGGGVGAKKTSNVVRVCDMGGGVNGLLGVGNGGGGRGNDNYGSGGGAIRTIKDCDFCTLSARFCVTDGYSLRILEF